MWLKLLQPLASNPSDQSLERDQMEGVQRRAGIYSLTELSMQADAG